MKKYNEIRLDREQKNDDIVIDCDSIHLERMDNNFWWLGIYKGKKRTAFNIFATESGIDVELVENGLKSKIIHLENEVEIVKL